MPEPPSSVPADPAYHHLLEQQAPEHWRPLSRAAPLAIVVSADAFALGWHAFQARRDAAPLVAAQYFVRTDRGAQDLLPQLRRFVAPGIAHVLGLDDLLADPGAGWGQYLADQGPALARLPHGLVVWLTRLGYARLAAAAPQLHSTMVSLPNAAGETRFNMAGRVSPWLAEARAEDLPWLARSRARPSHWQWPAHHTTGAG